MAEGTKPVWELKSGKDVAEALEWIRQRTKGRAMVLVAIGANGISFAKDPDVRVADAITLLEGEMETLRTELTKMENARQRRGAARRGGV
jgi:hypothetical protein